MGFGHVQLGASTGVTLTLPFVPQVSFSATTPFKVFTSGVQNQDFTRGDGRQHELQQYE